jgi:hypothetical protein
MIQKGDAKGNQNKGRMKNSVQHYQKKLFNGAHRGAEALVEIQFFDFFILIFLYFSLILYH